MAGHEVQLYENGNRKWCDYRSKLGTDNSIYTIPQLKRLTFQMIPTLCFEWNGLLSSNQVVAI